MAVDGIMNKASLRPQRPPNASSGHPGLIESWLEALTTQGSPAAGPNDDQCRSSSLDWLFPAVRLARGDPVLLVRHVFPVRAAYSRRVLRHVMGFPHRRRLCPIRHLVGLRRSPACLCAPCPTLPPERTPLQGSSPVRVPAQSVSSLHLPQEPSGLPEFSGASLPACHGLSTPADIHTLALHACFISASGFSTPSPSAGLRSRSCTSTSVSAISPAAYRILCVRLPCLLFAACAAPQQDQHSIRVGG